MSVNEKRPDGANVRARVWCGKEVKLMSEKAKEPKNPTMAFDHQTVSAKIRVPVDRPTAEPSNTNETETRSGEAGNSN